MPSADGFTHGTRSRYVAGCRCAECRNANRLYYHQRQAIAKAAAAEVTAPAIPVAQMWTSPDGTKKPRMYSRACPGVNGSPCPLKAHLRKDSKGGVCRTCRELLVWNGAVDAAAARAHVRELGKQGVGYKSVADAAGVARSVVMRIRSGAKKKLRRDTEKRILAVDAGAIADSATVTGVKTRAAVRQLLQLGYTRGRIAQEALGNERAALQLGRRVLASTQHKIEKLLRRVSVDLKLRQQLRRRCPLCGRGHGDDDYALEYCYGLITRGDQSTEVDLETHA